MSIPNYLNALANHTGPAKITAGGLSIPVKIMDLEHRSNPYSGDMCTFNCMVVNPEEIQPATTPVVERIAKQPVKSFYVANGPDYVRQALIKAAEVQALHEERLKASMPVYCARNPFAIKKVYFNDPVTVVLWADGTKTIVRCQEGDVYSKETGLALCFTKKALGNKGSFNDVLHKWIPEEEDIEPANSGYDLSDVIDEIRAVDAEVADGE